MQGVAGNEAYAGAGTQGNYVYYVPRGEGPTRNGLVARYDTTAPLSKLSSWVTALLPTTVTPPTWGGGVVFDGEYVYIAGGSAPILMRFHARTPAKMPKGFSGTFY